MRVVAENYEQTHTHIHTHTHTRDNYSNPRCANGCRGLIKNFLKYPQFMQKCERNFQKNVGKLVRYVPLSLFRFLCTPACPGGSVILMTIFT